MVEKDLLDRFEVKLVTVGVGSYSDPMQPMITTVKMTDELKSELIEALELGVNCPDEEHQRLTLLVRSVRHG